MGNSRQKQFETEECFKHCQSKYRYVLKRNYFCNVALWGLGCYLCVMRTVSPTFILLIELQGGVGMLKFVKHILTLILMLK
jgi:hypothetical protein